MAPLHREALGDVRLDLAAEAEDEAPLREGLQVPRRVGERHRRPGEGDGDRRAEFEMFGVLGAEQQRQERVVRCLGRPDAGIAGSFGFTGVGARLGEIGSEASVDFHAAERTVPGLAAVSPARSRSVGSRRRVRRRTASRGRAPRRPARAHAHRRRRRRSRSS